MNTKHYCRLLLTGTAMAVTFILSGCGPVRPQRDTISRYPQVHLTDWHYWGRVRVAEPTATRVGAGQLRIADTIRNATNHELLLDYQYTFLDSMGSPTQGRSGWMTVRVPSRGRAYIHFTSLTANADDFDLDIRPAR